MAVLLFILLWLIASYSITCINLLAKNGKRVKLKWFVGQEICYQIIFSHSLLICVDRVIMVDNLEPCCEKSVITSLGRTIMGKKWRIYIGALVVPCREGCVHYCCLVSIFANVCCCDDAVTGSTVLLCTGWTVKITLAFPVGRSHPACLFFSVYCTIYDILCVNNVKT